MERALKSLTVGMSALLVLSASFCGTNGYCAGKLNASDTNRTSATSEIAVLLNSLQQSIVKGDAKEAALLWTDDAIFIDEGGAETHGRNALQQRFEQLFTSRAQNTEKNGTIEFETERVSFPSSNVALIIGVVKRSAANDENPGTRFSMTAEKQNQKWLISQASETRIALEPNASADAHEHLKELDWLTGNWKAITSRGVVTMRVEWVPGKKFIRATCVSTDKDSTEEKTDTQIIGWDERSGSIVSWYFGYRGNFSYGKWRRNGTDWLVDIAGMNSDGSAFRETNIFSKPDSHKFTWQSTERTNAGTSLPDTEKLTIEKVSGTEQ